MHKQVIILKINKEFNIKIFYTLPNLIINVTNMQMECIFLFETYRTLIRLIRKFIQKLKLILFINLAEK